MANSVGTSLSGKLVSRGRSQDITELEDAGDRKKKGEPKSYDVRGYSEPTLDPASAYRVIRQIVADIQHDSPTIGLWVDMSGDLLKVHYHTYVMNLPSRSREIAAEADDALKKFVAYLKKEFKKRTKKALSMTEEKDQANYSIEKVSLNQRYYFKSWRFYRVSF